MDGVYRRQRYIYDFTRKYYLFGRDTLIRDLHLQHAQSLVEVGCGTGRNLILIARRYPDVRLFGLDASQEMLRTAQASIARHGLGERITLAHGYAEDLSPAMFGEKKPFDHAVFSYSLSMIPQWEQAVTAAAAALAPEGRIHAVDFGDLKGFGRSAANLMRIWLSLFHVTPRTDIFVRLEKNKSLFCNSNFELKFLPGHYAFLLNCDRETIGRMLAEDVAGQSQRARNSDQSVELGKVPMDFPAPHWPQ